MEYWNCSEVENESLVFTFHDFATVQFNSLLWRLSEYFQEDLFFSIINVIQIILYYSSLLLQFIYLFICCLDFL